jgi:hypothetical protein
VKPKPGQGLKQQSNQPFFKPSPKYAPSEFVDVDEVLQNPNLRSIYGNASHDQSMADSALFNAQLQHQFELQQASESSRKRAFGTHQRQSEKERQFIALQQKLEFERTRELQTRKAKKFDILKLLAKRDRKGTFRLFD